MGNVSEHGGELGVDLAGRTHFEREPKVGTRHIDLLRLYKRVCEEGGYDKVSDTKGNKLAWRRIAAEFLPGSSNVTTQAFIVKSAFYKNLAYDHSFNHYTVITS